MEKEKKEKKEGRKKRKERQYTKTISHRELNTANDSNTRGALREVLISR